MFVNYTDRVAAVSSMGLIFMNLNYVPSTTHQHVCSSYCWRNLFYRARQQITLSDFKECFFLTTQGKMVNKRSFFLYLFWSRF
jgi:hypothetical protein